MQGALLLQTAALSVDQWGIAGRVSVVVALTSSAFLVFFWRAVLRALWCAGLGLSASDLRAHTDESWKIEIARSDDVERQVHANVDRIKFLEASLLLQGKAFQDSLADAIKAQTCSMENMSRVSQDSFRSIEHALERITEDTNSNARAIAGLEGFLRSPDSGYSEPERRKNTRRKPEDL